MGIYDISRELAARLIFPTLELDDFYIQDFEYSGSLLTKDEFEIGTAPAMRFKVKLIDSTGVLKNYNFDTREFNAEIGIKEQEVINYHSIGRFTVISAIRSNDLITLECIDRMYKAETNYNDVLSYPATISQVLNSACTQAELECITTQFANNNYIIENKPNYGEISVRKILSYIAELAGGYALINKQGKLEILTLNLLNNVVAEINKDTYISLKFDEVATAMIDQVIVKVGAEESISGFGLHPYTIVDNIFVQNPQLVSQAIFNVLNGLNYSPVILRWQGDWALNLGDRLSIDNDESIKSTYLFDRKLTYKGGVREDIKASNKSDVAKNSTGKGSLTLDIRNIKTELTIQDGKIEQSISNNADEFSNINQELDQITTAVGNKANQSQVTQLVDEINSKVTQQDVQDLIDNINRANPNLVTNLPENWEQGDINNSTGAMITSLTKIRTKAYFPIRQGYVTFKVSNLYQAMIVLYNSSYGFKGSYGFASEHTFLLDENSYFKIVLRRVNGSEITPEAIATAELKVENAQEATQYVPYYGDLTLEQQQEFYQLDAQSSNGWVVDKDDFSTVLTARVYLFNEDVTMRFEPYQFTWYKQYPDGTLSSLGNGTSKILTGASLDKSATITCSFEIYDTIYMLATYNGDTLLTKANDNIMVTGDYQ